MNKRGELNNILKIVGAVLFVLLFIAIAGIVLFVVLSNVTPTITSTDSIRSASQTLTAVRYIAVNGSGYTFQDCYALAGGKLNQVSAILSNGTGTVTSSNYTLSACTLVSTTGLGNAYWNITGGNYTYLLTAQGASDLGSNLTIGTSNFFAQIPVIMTILGIVALITVVILIIIYVRSIGAGGSINVGRGGSKEGL